MATTKTAPALIDRARAASAASFRLRDYLRTEAAMRAAVTGLLTPVPEGEDPLLKDAMLLIEFTSYVRDAFTDDAKIVAFIRGEDLPYKGGF